MKHGDEGGMIHIGGKCTAASDDHSPTSSQEEEAEGHVGGHVIAVCHLGAGDTSVQSTNHS